MPSREPSRRPRPAAAREGLGQALYLQRDYAAAIKQHERAYAAYRRGRSNRRGRKGRAILAWITGNVLGDWAVHNGWLARALRILAEVGEDGPEHGWVLIISSYSEPDADGTPGNLCREAIAIGRRVADPNIEIEALASLGCSVSDDRPDDEGLALLDESMAALCAGELTEIATMDNLFCGLFWACELVNESHARTSGCEPRGGDGQPKRGRRILPRALRRHPDRGRALARGRGAAHRRRSTF